MGPCLVASSEIGDPKMLLLKTVVDGEVRQEEGVADLLFDCAYIVSYLSQGTTLQKGSVVMTGTPGGKFTFLSNCAFWDWVYVFGICFGEKLGLTDVCVGVGAGLSPPKYLVPGTQMDVSISGIGTLRNNVVFE